MARGTDRHRVPYPECSRVEQSHTPGGPDRRLPSRGSGMAASHERSKMSGLMAASFGSFVLIHVDAGGGYHRGVHDPLALVTLTLNASVGGHETAATCLPESWAVPETRGSDNVVIASDRTSLTVRRALPRAGRRARVATTLASRRHGPGA